MPDYTFSRVERVNYRSEKGPEDWTSIEVAVNGHEYPATIAAYDDGEIGFDGTPDAFTSAAAASQWFRAVADAFDDLPKS